MNTLTTKIKNTRGIRSSLPLSYPVSKADTHSKIWAARAQRWSLLILKAVLVQLRIWQIKGWAGHMHCSLTLLLSKLKLLSIIATILRDIGSLTRRASTCWQTTTMISSVYSRTEAIRSTLALACISLPHIQSFLHLIVVWAPISVDWSLLLSSWRKHIRPTINLVLEFTLDLPLHIESKGNLTVLLFDIHPPVNSVVLDELVVLILFCTPYTHLFNAGIFPLQRRVIPVLSCQIAIFV